jgi:hypothetical protein
MKKKVISQSAIAFLMVLALPLAQMAGAVEIKSGKSPARPGIEATNVITATGPGFTVYYVKHGTIRIQTKFMQDFAKTAVGRYVAEGIRKGVSIEDIVTKGMDAGYGPCDLLKGLIAQQVPLVDIIKIYFKKSILPCCGIMRCALDALRGSKMVEVQAGQYSVISPGRCAIGGSMTDSDWDQLEKLMQEGLISPEELPHFPPTKEQAVAAGCCETVELAAVFLAAGADVEDLRACLNAMGCSGLGYATPPPPPPPPTMSATSAPVSASQ